MVHTALSDNPTLGVCNEGELPQHHDAGGMAERHARFCRPRPSPFVPRFRRAVLFLSAAARADSEKPVRFSGRVLRAMHQ